MRKTILLLALVLVIFGDVVGIERFKCESSHMISCTMQIQKAVKKCSSENNVKGCVDQLLANSVCLSCLCEIVPAICYDEEQANQQQMKEIETLNLALNEVAECGQIEKYKCQNLIKKSVADCGETSKDCILKKIREKKCHVCLCSVSPDVCKKLGLSEKNLIKETSQTVSSSLIKDSPFESFESLLNLIPQQLKNQEKERETKGNLDNLLGLGMNFFQQTQVNPADLLNALNPQNIKPEEAAENESNPMSLINSLINKDSGFQDIQNQLMKNKNFQDIQQKLIQKVMGNPQVLTQMLSTLQGETPDLKTLADMFGDDLVSQMQNLENDGV